MLTPKEPQDENCGINAVGGKAPEGSKVLMLPQTPGGARRPLSGYDINCSTYKEEKKPNAAYEGSHAARGNLVSSPPTDGAIGAASVSKESQVEHGALASADAYFAAMASVLQCVEAGNHEATETSNSSLAVAFDTLDAQCEAVRQVVEDLEAAASAVEACDNVRLELAHYTYKVSGITKFMSI
jgi:hypothetical protein